MVLFVSNEPGLGSPLACLLSPPCLLLSTVVAGEHAWQHCLPQLHLILSSWDTLSQSFVTLDQINEQNHENTGKQALQAKLHLACFQLPGKNKGTNIFLILFFIVDQSPLWAASPRQMRSPSLGTQKGCRSLTSDSRGLQYRPDWWRH